MSNGSGGAGKGWIITIGIIVLLNVLSYFFGWGWYFF